MDRSQIKLDSDAGHGRYSYAFGDGSRAEMSYVERTPSVVTITHTYTPSQHRGQGIAARLVERAIEDFRVGGKKIIPACWFARRQFDEHPEWADLLYRG
jgi:predicted GNAT family acetyltransferase